MAYPYGRQKCKRPTSDTYRYTELLKGDQIDNIPTSIWKRLGLCIVWMIRYDTYRDTFDTIHDTYRRYVSDQIYDVTRHIFDKLVCTMLFITSALLRLECTIDCISGSVGHHQNVFPFIF